MQKTRYIAVHLLNDFSGSPRVLADFCTAQDIQAGALTIVTSGSKGFLHKGLGEMKPIWYPRSKSSLLNFLSYVLAQVQLFIVVFLLASRSILYGEKVVVINNTILCLGSMVASRLMGARTIAYVHEIGSGPAIMRTLAESIINWTAHEVIFVSQFLFGQYRFENKRCFVIPNGLRSDFKAEQSLDYGSKFRQRRVLFVGSLKSYKGVGELLKISAKLPDIPFTAVINCSQQELNDFSLSNNVPNNLSLFSREPSLQKFFSESFLVLNLSLPESWVETFGLTILEGMAFGCPCIVPPIGGHLDFFDSQCGLIVHGKETDQIADFIDKLQCNEDVWRGFSDHVLKIAGGYSAVAFKHRVDLFLSGEAKPMKNFEVNL
jgi:glycosyltransferase involved in cell wall biosynthesis